MWQEEVEAKPFSEMTQTEAKALEERLRSEIEGPYLAKIDELDNAVHEKIED